VSISGTVTSTVSDEDTNDIVSDIADAYGVEDGDVEVSVQYITTGILNVSIEDSIPQFEALASLEAAISAVLGVHISDVTVSMNDDNTITYSLSKDTYDDVKLILNATSLDSFITLVNANLESSDSSIVVDSATADNEIEVVISATVDTTDSIGRMENLAEVLRNLTESYGFVNSTFEDMFITSMPTMHPTETPLTSIPSTSPSLTGLIVSININIPSTSTLTSEEVIYIQEVVAQSYGVNTEDVSTFTEYVTTGSVDVTISDGVAEDITISELVSALSQVLDIPSESISVFVDSETGDVTYAVSTTEYDATEQIFNTLQGSTIADLLNGFLDNVSVDSVSPVGGVFAETTVVVDADDVTVSLQTAENLIEAIFDDTTIDVSFVSSSPTNVPSSIPSGVPTSAIPSQAPSITGAVVFIEMNAIVTETLSEDDITNIISNAEATFDVYPGSVDVEVSYDITGSVAISFNDNYDDSQLVDALEESIANVLNIHPSDIVVTSYDIESGVATYLVSSETAEAAKLLSNALQSSETSDAIVALLSSSVESVETVSNLCFDSISRCLVEIAITPNFGVSADVVLTIDATNTADINNSLELFTVEYAEEWNVNTQCMKSLKPF